ncbi:BLUF domain-containing protein [uncultured Salinisphaera sp.]|uniref:BLUF domain-containing protein n=1 Tax=uncultured Salinisphaera sp. TaxID=359372 RepID=UPI0032B1EB2C|tara:strand:- start:3910 stop:4392 length:483 start_codon:yes stop_codon:yes gene_type:complete
MFDEPGFERPAEPDNPELPLLYHVVYCSRAGAGVDEAEVDRIVEVSQRQNPERRITGVLMFAGGVFFQWIEGPRSQIKDLMAAIRADPRHHDIVSLSETEETRERLYPDWDMERVDAEDIREVLNDALDTAEDQNNVVALKRILSRLDSGPLDSLGQGQA